MILSQKSNVTSLKKKIKMLCCNENLKFALYREEHKFCQVVR